MTPATFRRLSLNLPEAVESAHMGHPDFRVGGKIFATLGCDNASADETWGMVKLTPPQQADFVAQYPKVFQPFNGAWGRRGCTKVLLKAATNAAVAPALVAAWSNIAPKRLTAPRGDD